jgi:heterodisulfide reductase subunit A
MISFSIDGRKIEAERGKTVLEAASDIGIKIPTLCFHKAMLPQGACRLCVVEIKGRSKLVASCAHPVEDGIEVSTNSPRVLKARKLVAELLYLHCPNVPRVQELAREMGAEEKFLNRFTADDEKCILCGLCVRICDEQMGVNAIDFVGRGYQRKVSPPFDQLSPICITCGACESVCPTGAIDLLKITANIPRPIPSEYNEGMDNRHPIYIPFPQAVPKMAVIDRENCLFFQRGVCKTCSSFCQAKAINHEQEDEITQIEAGAVVLATGFEIIDPEIKKELGYGRYQNVISSLQFERLMSASGPHLGTVLRPSDLTPPKRIAFIQCVGSRDIDHKYCSSVCCMYTTKEATIVREHAPETECTIFYIDIRAFGKGYEAFYQRAKEEGIRYIRSHPSAVREVPGTKNLSLQFEGGDGKLTKEEFDLVVLSVGMQATPKAKQLAETFGINTDGHGFVRTNPSAPVDTSNPGVFVAGVLSGPKDIPESVMEASAAASRAMTLLADTRGSLVREKTYQPETDITGQDLRLGVFVCHCGRNIGGVIDVPSVVEYARTLPNVVYAEDNLYTCSTDSCERIQEKIHEQGLNRVIVASCTPRTHEQLFRDTIRQAGLNPYLFEMVNIRDQCSWVHMHEPEKATKKAKDLVRMGVTRAQMLEPLYPEYIPVNPHALVLGGGLAGMTAALALSSQGFETYLLEKDKVLGGNMRRVRFLFNGNDPQEILSSLIDQVTRDPLIHTYTSANIVDFEGSVGNFKTRFTSNGETHEIVHGAVIVATGAREHQPTEYLYNQNPKVISQFELEDKLSNGGLEAQSVTMIQCVGACDEPHGYCSRVCCSQAVKTALKIKEKSPSSDVFILHKDMRTYGFYESRYREAREKGVRFIRMAEGSKPEVSPNNGHINVSVMDDILRARLNIKTDLLVLSNGIDPEEGNSSLAQTLKLPLTQDGFFLEAHMKLRPVDFATDGIFLCGLAHGPKNFEESISQASAAAARAATILSKPRMQLEATISEVIDENCDGCAYCVDPCPYNAIALMEYVTSDGTVKKTVDADPSKCRGCGVCQATCPKKGIIVRNFRLDMLGAMVDAALAG